MEPEHDLLSTTDAQVWAKEYMRLHGEKPVSEDLLLTWFANAIETGRSAGQAAV